MSRQNSRWTYIHGTRPEGVIVYDGDLKLHSHHDSDPARGQHSAWDAVRLHLFGKEDAGSEELPIVDRPSHRKMVQLAESLPEIRAARAAIEFVDLGDAPAAESGAVDERSDTASARFQVIPANEFGSGPPLEWLVRGVLPRAELAVVFGESGSGKSFFALDLCAAITRGFGWKNKRTTQGGVVYVCAEGSGGFKARLKAYAHAHEVELAELPAVIADAPNLLEPKDAGALTKAIADWIAQRGKSVDVVVIDTLSATTPGGNENSGEDIGRVVSHCKRLHRETGALVVLVHHSGKDATKGARGWSGLRAAADTEIEITRNGDYREATITKMKDGTDGEKFAFKLKVVDLGMNDGEVESSCVVEHSEIAAPASRVGKMKPVGKYEPAALETLKVMAPSGTVDLTELINGIVPKLVKDPDGRDLRRKNAFRAVEQLCVKKLAYMHGEDRVSLTSLVTSDEEGWLK